ncbi:hypothetical protein L0665_06000 [Methanogenium marinum]|uniref:Uncharacterized protein n=1 Tax=Methanogenium marinum TaxID=348610 RepID=A0A9Q4KVA7_9EURY|nr:hypothetical protein [Methanogenium marinum]MDE4908160.1 hypothetical protein [Methanogenium marinum]
MSSMHQSPNPDTEPDTKPVAEPASVTILISPRTQERLDFLKESSDESYDSVIARLTDRAIDDEPLSEETLKTIEKSLAELRKGIFYTHEEIVQKLIERTEGCEPEEK